MALTTLVLHAMAVIAAASIPHGTPDGTPTVEKRIQATGNAPVNPILGDRSFVERFGRRPNPSDPEALRIATHLAYVEHLLRSRDVSTMPADLRAERQRNLDRLHAYRLSGRFPHNAAYPGARRPCFIDGNGTICAVGYLVEASKGRAVAESINRRFQYATIHRMRSPELDQWVAGSGLTLDEAAMVQPAYYTPPSIFAGVSGGITFPIHSRMQVPPELKGNVSPLGTKFGTTPLASIQMTWAFQRNDRWPCAIMTRAAFDNRSIDAEGPTRDVSFTDTSGGTQTREAYYAVETEYKMITMDVLWAQRIGRLPLVVLAGPSLGVVLSARRRDAWVPTMGFASPVQSDAPFKSPRLGFKAGVQYELTAHRTFTLVPYALVDAAITGVRENDPWRVDAAQLGIELRVPLNAHSESVGDGG